MKINCALIGVPNLKRMLPMVIALFLVITQFAVAVGGSFGNAVLCIESGDHIAVELLSHPRWHGPDSDQYSKLRHSHSSKPCTDISLPKIDPFVRGQNVRDVSSAQGQIATMLPYVRPTNGRWTSLNSRLVKQSWSVQTLSLIRTVILRL